MNANKRTTDTIARIKELKEETGHCPKCGLKYIRTEKDEVFPITWYIHEDNHETITANGDVFYHQVKCQVNA